MEIATDKNNVQYQHLVHEQDDSTRIEVRVYERKARFAAILPAGKTQVKFILDLVVPAEDYLEDPKPYVEAAYNQAQKRAWWLDNQEIEYDHYGTPFVQSYYHIGTFQNPLPGELAEVEVRFRHYPKTVRPQLIYRWAPVNGYTHYTTYLLDSMFQDGFNPAKAVGNIRRSLAQKGYKFIY